MRMLKDSNQLRYTVYTISTQTGGLTEDGEVDLESADAVAGGKACVCIFGGGSTGNDDKDGGCCCIGLGNGTNDDYDNRCGCVLVGVGNQCTYEGELF